MKLAALSDIRSLAEWMTGPAASGPMIAVLWGPVGCGKTVAVRRAAPPNLPVRHIDGDEDVLARAESRHLIVSSLFSAYSGKSIVTPPSAGSRGSGGGTPPPVVVIDDVEAHGDGAAKLLTETLAAAKAHPPLRTRLLFIGNDPYAAPRQLTLPHSGRVVQMHMRAPSDGELRAVAMARWPTLSAPALDMAVAVCGGDMRVLVRTLATDGDRVAANALVPHAVARDLLYHRPAALSQHDVEQLLARTNGDFAMWLIQQNAPQVCRSGLDVAAATADCISLADTLSSHYGTAIGVCGPLAHIASCSCPPQRRTALAVTARPRLRTEDVPRMATAGLRSMLDALRAAGQLAAYEDKLGHGAAPTWAWRRREWLVATGIVEPWGGAAHLPPAVAGMLSGTGVIEQAAAYDPAGLHTPIHTERQHRPSQPATPVPGTPVPGTPRRMTSDSNDGTSPSPTPLRRSTGTLPAAKRQKTMPYFFRGAAPPGPPAKR